MKLSVYKREAKQKGEVRRIRRQEDVPGVLYGPKFKNEPVYFKGAQIEELLRKVKKGALSSTLFVLEYENREHKALVKAIQYHKTSYRPIHLDFQIVAENSFVNVDVPIECIHIDECVGAKLGGMIRQVIRHLRVHCLPKDIPSKFQLDVKHMNMMQSKRLSDIEIPENVRPVVKQMDQVVVVVAKR